MLGLSNHRSSFVCGVLVILFGLSSSTPVLAQCKSQTDYDVHPKLAKGEGLLPAYISGADVFQPPFSGGYSGETEDGQELAYSYIWHIPGQDDLIGPAVNGRGPMVYSVTETAFGWTFDDADTKGFSPSDSVIVLGNDGCEAWTSTTSGSYVVGVTLVRVVDGSTGKPIDCDVSFINAAQPSGSVVFHQSASKGKVVFGQAVYNPADCPYPKGMASRQYFLQVQPGRPYSYVQSAALAGTDWPGKTITLTLTPDGAVGTSSLAPTTAADNPDAPPSSPGGSGSDSGSAFSLSGLMDAITKFFTLDPADLKSITDVGNKFATYGPFSLPAQIKAQWDQAFAGPGLDGSQPNYWVLPLSLEVDSHAAPNGYTATPPPPPPGNQFYSSIFPKSLDFTPCSNYILKGRTLTLIALWLFVGFNLVKRFTPSLRV